MSAPTRRARRDRPRAQRPSVEPAPLTTPESEATKQASPPPASETPVPPTAEALSTAEQALAVLEVGYEDAHHLWTNALRRSGRGEADEKTVKAAQAGLDRADARRVEGREAVERLRRRLYEERQREMLLDAVARQEIAHHESARRSAEPRRRRSLLDRLLRRS